MLAHNFIPHQHEDNYHEVQIRRAETSCCIVNWFRVVLNIDFGEEHLEIFNSSENSEFKTSSNTSNGCIAILNGLNAYPINYLTQRIDNSFFTLTIKTHHLNSNQLRGPPAIS